jgi:hypothetical protein
VAVILPVLPAPVEVGVTLSAKERGRVLLSLPALYSATLHKGAQTGRSISHAAGPPSLTLLSLSPTPYYPSLVGDKTNSDVKLMSSIIIDIRKKSLS